MGMKRLLGLLALCVALMMLATPVMAEGGTIIMGTNAAFPPFEYLGDDGQPDGFDVAIAREIAKDLGKELVVDDMVFDGLLAALQSGKIDFVAAGMTVKEERKEFADFSDSYFTARQKIVVQKGYDGIQTTDDIADKKVAVQDGTTGFYMATDDFGVPETAISGFKATVDAIMELKTGRVDCVILDSNPAEVFVSQNDDIEMLDIELPDEFYAIAVGKGNTELLDSINATLARLHEDGTFDALVDQYITGATAN